VQPSLLFPCLEFQVSSFYLSRSYHAAASANAYALLNISPPLFRPPTCKSSKELTVMSTLSASAAAPQSGLLIDPAKQAEYPILLGDRLAGKADNTRFINIAYNHKSKSATPQQRATITRSSTSQDLYNLMIKDKAGNTEQTSLTYSYRGSVDPSLPVQESDTRNLVLVFDPKQKAFILESVSTNLHFNLRSAPGKSDKQVIEQFPQLSTLPEDDQASGDDRCKQDGGDDEKPEAADESNPYDYRHFLPKENAQRDKPASTPDPHNTVSRVNTPTPSFTKAAKPKPKPLPKTKTQTNPLRQVKRPPKAAAVSTSSAKTKSQPKSASRIHGLEDIVSEFAPSDEDQRDSKRESSKIVGSPNSNIIIDGDLIIDMGSPPPSRPAFKVNPTHFSSNNTSANEADDDDGDDEEEIEDLRLPSPAPQNGTGGGRQGEAPADEMEDDDALAAEMEAAFEEEEEARSHQLQQQQQYTVPSDDESEVSEEE
jgi:hypothetical protein